MSSNTKAAAISKVEIRQRLEMVDNIDDLFNVGGMIMQDKAAKKLRKAAAAGQNESDSEEVQNDDGGGEEDKFEDISLAAKSAESLSEKKKGKVKKTEQPVLDPDSYVRPTKISGSSNVVVMENSDSEEDLKDSDDDQGAAIAEAFADDDVGNEFQSEKDALKKARQAQSIDLTLPGWGDWGGQGLKVKFVDSLLLHT